MKPTIRLVIITALRDRLFVSLLALLAAAFGISVYLGAAALTEASEMTVVYAAGASRVVVVLGLIVFTAFHVERLFDTREIEAILSRAISRGRFAFSYWLGLAAIAMLFIVPAAVMTMIFSFSYMGAAAWSASVFLEALIVLAFTLFAAFTMERAIPTIFTAVGFYALARLMSFFTGIALTGNQSGLNHIANTMITAMSYMVPRLDLAGQTRWLVYEPDIGKILGLLAAQTAIYVPLLLSAAVFDLRRKYF